MPPLNMPQTAVKLVSKWFVGSSCIKNLINDNQQRLVKSLTKQELRNS